MSPRFPVSLDKENRLLARLRAIGILERDLDEQFEGDARWVRKDLETLKQVLEA